MPVALFGIDDGGLNLAVNLLVLFLVVLWIALVVWTHLDARRRIEDSVLVTCATVASLFPFVGTVVYAILRPPEFLEDAHERELEIRAAELRVRQLAEQSCPNCEYPIERSYLRCPSCRARLKDPCPSCAKPLDPRWSVCPYCETPIQRVRRRRPVERGGRPEPRGRAEARARAEPRGRADAKRRAVRPKRKAPSEKAASAEGAPAAEEPERPRRRVNAARRTKRSKAPSGAAGDGAEASAGIDPAIAESHVPAEERSTPSKSRPASTS